MSKHALVWDFHFGHSGTVRVLQSEARSQGEALESFAKTRVALAERMTPAQIAEAQRLAREWKPKTWEELKQELEANSL